MLAYLIHWIFIPSLFFILGYVLRASMTTRYRARGTIRVVQSDGKVVYTLAFDEDPDEVLGNKDEVLFEIHR